MPRTGNQSKRKSSRTWRDISQGVKPKSMSSAAWKRMQLGRVKKIGAILVLALALLAGFRFATNVEQGPLLLSQAGKTLPVRYVQTQSDGVLDREWILGQLGLDQLGGDLLKIDITSVRRKLEDSAQVRKAQIEKRFPETLFVSVEEREPIARIVARSLQGNRLQLLVDAEGVVYEGIGYDSKLIASLPYLDIEGLKKEDGKFAKLEGLDEVGELLNEAKTIAPHLYRTWKVVSLRESPNIIVKSRNVKEARFEPKNYRSQLVKLDYIIDYNRSRMMNRVSKIDLTLGSQVPVKAAVFTH